MSDYSRFRLIPSLPLTRLPGSGELGVSTATWEGGRGFTLGSSSDFESCRRWLRESYPRDLPWLLSSWGRGGTAPDYRSIKESRVRGVERWVDPGVRSLDDVFDVLALDVGRLLLSSLTLESAVVLEEAMEISDSCLPLLMCDGHDLIHRKKRSRVEETLRLLYDLGYQEAIVMDLPRLGRGLGPSPALERLSSSELRIIPAGGLVENDIPRLMSMGFTEAIRDPRLPAQRDAADVGRPLPSSSTLKVRDAAARGTRAI